MKNPLFAALFALTFVLPGIARHAHASDELTLYFINSAWPIDWSTPGTAIRTSIASNVVLSLNDGRMGVKSHSIGHTHIHVHCDATRGQPERDIWTAVTNDHDEGQDSDQTRQKALLNGKGAAEQLIRDVRGKYYTPDEVKKDLAYIKEKLGFRMGEATWKVSPEACKRMGDFYDYYNENQKFKVFGSLAARPMCGDGGGCTAYGMAFAEQAGVLDDSIVDATQICLRVKEKFLNYPGHEAERSMRGTLIFGGEWAKPGEPGYDLCFLDPSKARDWVYNLYQHGEYQSVGSAPIVAKQADGNAVQVVIDARRLPVPKGPLLRSCPPRGSDVLVPRNEQLRLGTGPDDTPTPLADPLRPRIGEKIYNEVPVKQPAETSSTEAPNAPLSPVY